MSVQGGDAERDVDEYISPANLLNLPEYRITRVQESTEDYHIHAEVWDAPTCPICSATDITKWGAREQLIKDLPMHGKRVGIYVKTRRVRCEQCSKTSYESLPHVSNNRNMTDRLVKWIGRQSLKRVFTSIADETGVDEKTVRNIFREYVCDLEEQVRFETPRWLGIDEIHIVKPRCVVSNIESRTIVNILPDRNMKTVAAYLSSLEGREVVRYAAMDMWVPYREAVHAILPNAQVVVDKFHVLRMANVAMEAVRKSLRSSLGPKERRGLMHDRFILLRRERDLDTRQRFLLDSWTKLHPSLGEAYRLKEGFFAIYDAEDEHDAVDRYGKWQQSIPEGILAAFQPILTAWKNWHPEILGYFDHPITNAYTESLNNLIRVMNRLGRGYSFEALRAKILFTEGLQKEARPKFERLNRRALPMVSCMTSFDPMTTRPTRPENLAKSLGVDIPTLTKHIEAGDI